MEIQLDRASRTPVYLQIVDRLRELILRGVVPEGGRLPPSRKLAETLGVNRTTVIQAYNILWSEGLVESRVGSGTVVRSSSETEASPAAPPPWSMLFSPQIEAVEQEVREILKVFSRDDVISLAAGLPPSDLYPIAEIGQLTAEVYASEGESLLHWSSVEGYLPLRRLLADQVEGLTPGEVLILSGSTQGLYLLARNLIEPGDSVVVESPTYLGALQAFEAAGARFIGVPVDRDGMKVEMLESVLSRTQPKFIYTVPAFHNPTGANMTLERRRALLDLTYRYRIPIVEDDPYGPLRYEGDALPSLKALDTRDHVIYLSSFTKTVCAGLRVGWMAAPRQVIERLIPARYLIDFFTNPVTQAVVYHFCQRGLLEEHISKMRGEYRKRRDAMIAALRRHCPTLTFTEPEGGYFIWCRLPRGVNAKELLREALKERVAFIPGAIFYPDNRGQDRIRLTFTSHPPAVIQEAIRGLGVALRRVEKARVEEPLEEVEAIRTIV